MALLGAGRYAIDSKRDLQKEVTGMNFLQMLRRYLFSFTLGMTRDERTINEVMLLLKKA